MSNKIRNLDTQANITDDFLQFSCATETPYLRSDDGQLYYQVLVISEDTLSFNRLVDDRAPLLVDHNMQKAIGVVKKAYIKNKKLYVKVKFANTQLAKQIKEQMMSDLRRNVSIGYTISHMTRKGEIDGIPVYYVDNFEIYEVSSVSCAADVTCGVNRSLQIKENTEMIEGKQSVEEVIADEQKSEQVVEEVAEETAEVTEEVKEQVVEEVVEEAPVEEEKAEETIEEEISEEQEIRAAGELANEEELAEECIKEKRSLAEFKSLLKQKRSNKNIKKEKTMEKFSISKAIRNACSQYKKDISNDYETKVIEENKRSLGIGDEADIVVKKSQLKAFGPTQGHGAELVATDYLPQEFTPALRPQHTLQQTGYYSIPVNGNAVQFCVMEEGATASMYGLDGELADGDLKFSTRTLTPKKGGVVIPIPYSLILQGRPEVDTIVEADIVEALAQLRDKMILVGTGADNQPKGIVNTDGVNKVAYAEAFTWTGVCTMEKLIRDANIFAPLCWVMNSTNKVKYETTLKDDNGFEGYICTDDKIKNMPVFVNNALGDDEIILGAFENVAVADFDAIQLKVDDITLAKKQAIQVIASNAFDVAVRRPKAFTVTKAL